MSSQYKTSGERLLQYIRTDVLKELHDDDLMNRVKKASAPTSRDSNFALALQDLAAMNLLQRLILETRYIFDKFQEDAAPYLENDPLISNEVQKWIKEAFRIETALVSKLSTLTIDAIIASKQKLNKSLQRDVFEVHGLYCYTCGTGLQRRNGYGNEATVEHVWPRSLGGDTNFDNLLPACKSCNSNRNESSVWSSFWFQACYLKPHPSQKSIETKLGVKMKTALQFYRADDLSRRKKISLKGALLRLGPVTLPDFHDHESSSDFFTILSSNNY